MVNNNGTTPQPGSKCLFDQTDYTVYTVIPALFIITILSFLNKRVGIKPNTCGGKPALVLPMNFLGDSIRNRLSIAMAFGVLAGDSFQLFNSISGFERTTFKTVDIGSTPWEKAGTTVVQVLLYGIVNYPVLACLTTDNQLIGSIFGLLYMLMKFIAKMILLCSCVSPITQGFKDAHISRVYEQTGLFLELPTMFCHGFLLIRFSMILRKEVIKLRRHPECVRCTDEDRNMSVVAKLHDFIHVRLLFRNKLNDDRSDGTDVWYIRLRNAIYKTRPDFKYSTELVSTLTVGAIFIYHMTVYFIMLFTELNQMMSHLHKQIDNAPHTNITSPYIVLFEYAFVLMEIFSEAYYISLFCTCTWSFLMILHLLKCHRSHVLKVYKARFFPNSPSRLVVRSLSYPGFQIAYIGLGFIIMLVILSMVSLIVVVIIKYWKEIQMWKIVIHYLPIMVVPLVIWLFQYLLGWLVFRDRRFPDSTVTIDNHRLYCIMSFFFFFFNILIGFYSSLFRTLKSMALGVFFLSRIDRTPLMAGFHKWDKGYLSYIGFLNVLKASSHPVMLVFCHLLIRLRHDYLLQALEDEQLIGDSRTDLRNSIGYHAGRGQRRSFSSRSAFNRWLVAYTLLRNPDLIPLRKKNLRLISVGRLVDNVVFTPSSFINADNV